MEHRQANPFAPNPVLHGSPGPLPERILLRAGPLTLVFEAGDLRSIRLARREVVRRIYSAVRDAYWATIPGEISDLVLEGDADCFHASYRSDHRAGPIHFVSRATLTGASDGTVTFAFSGEALSSFERNRIGLCVLHPIRECAGRPVRATLTSGTQRDLRFPVLVAVEQPIEGFTDLSALAYDAGRDTRIELAFEGDRFETEDQRNWIDASFKTYSTPLALPKPVVVAAGTRIEQRVTLRVVSRASARTPPPGGRQRVPADVPVDAPAGALPPVGVGLGVLDRPLDSSAFELLRELRPVHIRADVSLEAEAWRAHLQHALDLHRALGSGLELALDVAPASGPVLDALAGLLPADLRLARLLVFAADRPTTSAEVLALVRDRLLARRPDLGSPGVGSRMDLYQFHLVPPPQAELLCWSMNPHAHASDLTSLAETPPAAGDQVRSVRARHRNAWTAVTPVTLGPRARGSLPPPPTAHPLHACLFGGAWTLAVAAHLATAGVDSVTFLESVRELGSATGTHPLFHVLADLRECFGGRLTLQPAVADGEEPDAGAALLVGRDASRAVLLLANLTGSRRHVPLPASFEADHVRILDIDTAERAGRDRAGFRREHGHQPAGRTLALNAFATARVDGRLVDR
ncbi:MAG: hypothetical protein GEV06_22560 [Luteitalea sp.]|nr:hypothetical protein [Luteitalea sp.]